MFSNLDHSRGNLLRRLELFELRASESRDLNFKATLLRAADIFPAN